MRTEKLLFLQVDLLIMLDLRKGMQTSTSLLAGFFLFLTLYFCGKYLSEQHIVPKTFPEVREFFFLVLFLGVATGHFIGKSLREDERCITYFLAGFFCPFSVYAVRETSFQTSIYGILLSSAMLLFLLHVSGLLTERENIDSLIDIIAGKGSIVILFLASLWHYVRPVILYLLEDILG
jgi:hypothetical protein